MAGRILTSAAILLVGRLASDVQDVPDVLPSPARDPILDEVMLSRFKSFLQTSGRSYKDRETFAKRLAIFSANAAFIDDFNRRSSDGLKLGVNQFADLTRDEFRQTYLSSIPRRKSIQHPRKVGQKKADSIVNMNVPSSIDWRQKGAVTPVKDQKDCGSCWAFSTTGAIEGAYFLASGKLVSLSEGELVDCAGDGNHGCRGGEPDWAFKWVERNGICSEKSYPYTGFGDECHNQWGPCSEVVQISGFKDLQENSELALKNAVAQQPVSVLIEADTDIFRFYKSGVLKDKCGTGLDHAVLAVGYGTESGQDYWLVKNSWNASWGDEGYIKLARTDSSMSYGECGIAMQASYPVISSSSLVV
eukprot:TRINITY_DN114373_c0_g1_i1.p1 TRINITY_DN114373_c0_g1~~TRINITY_DN114373_c0_g1_i1.p1  ORF type:complete len:360 (+),score=67.08 TRINITY_DN114373_c0_g1_i1:77-1156(+)